MMTTARLLTLAGTVAALAPWPGQAQWSNRYPKVDGFGHHVYLEGFELPTLSNGPIDPAASPDGRTLAFSSQGFLWSYDLETRIATQLTSTGAMDFRPAWSPDGRSLVFVRDDTRDTRIMLRDLESGHERVLVDTDALDLDPVFVDEQTVVFSSAQAGTIDLWEIDVTSGDMTPVTNRRGLEMRAQPAAGGLVYLHKAGAESVRLRGPTGQETVLAEERILSQTRPAVSPDGYTVAVNWPTQDRYELRLLDTRTPGTTVLLTAGDGLPLTPAFSADGGAVFFSEADANERMQLKQIDVAGGAPRTLQVMRWDYAQPMGLVRVRTNVPARLTATDVRGHPVVPSAGMMSMEGQHGNVFFYTGGTVLLRAPAGELTVTATRGLTTRPVMTVVDVDPETTKDVHLELEDVWDASAAGYMSGDHHFHLNYGGAYQLSPADLVPMMLGENLDVATPLVANLHNRFSDQALFATGRSRAPIVRFGQEVRSHFLGHIGLINTNRLHWPWIWGPGYQVYGRDDRTNASVMDFAREQGGFGWYVHPYAGPDPFAPAGMERVPVELVADAVLGKLDGLEIVCLWSNEMGTTDLWYRFLNIGQPVAPVAGTDVMNDYYHTMAVGVTRVYVRTGSQRDVATYYDGLRAGRSFVTTGPILDFTVHAAGNVYRPGDAVPEGSARLRVELTSVVPVERLEIVVNGEIVESREVGNRERRDVEVEIDLPAGGWVAARAVGGPPQWPALNNVTFAHTAPVWIGEIGSTDPQARATAARELLEVLSVSERRLRSGYGETPTPVLDAHFARARQALERLMRN